MGEEHEQEVAIGDPGHAGVQVLDVVGVRPVAAVEVVALLAGLLLVRGELVLDQQCHDTQVVEGVVLRWLMLEVVLFAEGYDGSRFCGEQSYAVQGGHRHGALQHVAPAEHTVQQRLYVSRVYHFCATSKRGMNLLVSKGPRQEIPKPQVVSHAPTREGGGTQLYYGITTNVILMCCCIVLYCVVLLYCIVLYVNTRTLYVDTQDNAVPGDPEVRAGHPKTRSGSCHHTKKHP